MRKSSVGGRTSFSGAPLRIRSDNVPSKSRPSSTFENRLSFGGSLAYGGTKLPMLNQRKSSQISFVPKSRGSSTSHHPVGASGRSRASSGIGVRGRTDIPKDPRPVSDKRYQTQCIKQLMEFLMVYNYPHPVSQKLLVSPSSKDFFRIFEFIYGRFVRGYKQGQKMEEEVPRILKMLGYPYALSKSSLFSVGSPHTWPYLLVALTWMIDLLRMTESISKEYNGIDAFIFETTDDDFDGVSEEKIVFDYCEKTYKAFLQGVDTFDEYDQAVEQALMQKHQGGNISNLLAENTRLEAEVELLEQAEERKKQLKEAVSMSQHDAKVIRTYMENLQQYKRVQEGELQKRVEDFEMMKSDLQSGRERLAHMQNIYEKQDLTPADVERLRAEQEALKQHVDHLEKQIASIDTDTWTITMEQAKLNEKVETEIAAYNRQAIALKLVPETAELANGRDFRLRSGFNSDIVSDFENNVKPMLTLMKKRCTSELRRKNKEKFQMALEMEQFQETVNEQKEKLVQMGKELANKEAEIESMKQMFHSGKKTEEIEALQQELSQLDPLCKQADAEAARAVKEYGTASSALSVKKVDVKRHLSEMEENLLQVKGFTTEVLDGLQNQLHGYVSKVDAADADISRRIAQLQLKSKQRKERLASMMKK